MTEVGGKETPRRGEKVIPLRRRGAEALDDEHGAAGEALKSGWLTQGREVQELASRGGELLGREVVPVAGGGAAAYLALLALDLAGTDEVVLPSLVPPSLANLVLFAGGRPVFADIVDPATPVVDPDDVARRIGLATRAIVVYHTAGHPAAVSALADLAERHGLALVEVCWEALGARLGGRPVGTFGLAGAFAFGRAADGGGFVACADTELRMRIESLRSTILEPSDEAFEHYFESIPGNGYRIDEAAAAAGIGVLETLEQRIAGRRDIIDAVSEREPGDVSLGFRPGYLAAAEPSYDALPVLTKSADAAIGLARRARTHGIEAVLPQAAHRLPPHHARLPRLSLPRTEDYCTRAVELPVVEQLRSFELT
jgi:perosamine synthetase